MLEAILRMSSETACMGRGERREGRGPVTHVARGDGAEDGRVEAAHLALETPVHRPVPLLHKLAHAVVALLCKHASVSRAPGPPPAVYLAP